jgi:uncharacterized membrane protein YqhA
VAETPGTSRKVAGAPESADSPATPPRGMARRLPAYSRFVVGVPVIGLFVGAVALVGLGAVETVRTLGHIFEGDIGKAEAMIEFIQLADAFLLATVLYVMALGLYELFIDDRIPVPKWLQIHTLDDLKSKLVSVVVVVMAVLFLGAVISTETAIDLMYRGVGIGAIIAALAYFGKSQKGH